MIIVSHSLTPEPKEALWLCVRYQDPIFSVVFLGSKQQFITFLYLKDYFLYGRT